MQYIYTTCDLCGCPIKDENYYFSYIIDAQFTQASKDYSGEYKDLYYKNLVNDISKSAKEICPNCKTIIEEIFRLRKKNLNNLSKDLLCLYQLSDKDNKEEKREREIIYAALNLLLINENFLQQEFDEIDRIREKYMPEGDK